MGEKHQLNCVHRSHVCVADKSTRVMWVVRLQLCSNLWPRGKSRSPRLNSFEASRYLSVLDIIVSGSAGVTRGLSRLRFFSISCTVLTSSGTWLTLSGRRSCRLTLWLTRLSAAHFLYPLKSSFIVVFSIFELRITHFLCKEKLSYESDLLWQLNEVKGWQEPTFLLEISLKRPVNDQMFS